jgi:mono/diheme cytochrome c family protein
MKTRRVTGWFVMLTTTMALAACGDDSTGSDDRDGDDDVEDAGSDSSDADDSSDSGVDGSTDSGGDADPDGVTDAATDTATDVATDTEPPPPPLWATTSGWTSSDCADAEVDVAAGMATYNLFCASCHGGEGVGTTFGPAVRFPVVDFAAWVVRNGRNQMGYPGPMTPYGADVVSDESLCDILAYLRSFEEPQDGQALYTTFCANCHGDDGLGGRTGKDIADSANDALEKIREGDGGTSYGSQRSYMPHWESDELSSAEIDQIIEYIRSL